MRQIDADALKEDLTRFYAGEVTARDLIDKQPTIGGWISVKDRLPEDGVLVLVSHKVDYGLGMTMTIVDTAMYQPYGFCGGGYDNFRACQICSTEVTHWMPLPEPPKEDDA